jgi:hypothetical protein
MVHQEMKATAWVPLRIVLHTVLVVFGLTLGGCASMETIKPVDTLKGISQRFRASLRKQGEKKVLTPEQTQAKYACPSSRETRLYLEEVQILPEVVSPGKELNQRIRYALCRATASGTLKGSITRAVSFNGEEMFRDVTNYEFKAGTWIVDVFIGIPQEAVSGAYSLDTALKYSGQTLRESDVFIVKGR